METHKCTPVMLAVIGKIILSRCGFQVDIVSVDDTSHRMALGVRDDQVYFEVCNAKWGMTEWNPDAIKPCPPKNILLWEARNMEAFYINVAGQRQDRTFDEIVHEFNVGQVAH